jgi:proline dehydrogenase
VNVLRSALLAGADNAWLRRRATNSRIVRRAVARFMPGESLDDALAATEALRPLGLGTILTRLGENVTDRAEADAVADHYLQVADRVAAAGLDAEISVKLTQLGLDQGDDLALANVSRIAERAAQRRNRVAIDMESTAYTERTLALYRSVRQRYANTAVCVQAYLRRTPVDVEALIPLGATVRLVKGAYKEPASLAYPQKHDVDEAFFQLTQRLLSEPARQAGVRLTIGTHDRALIDRILAFTAQAGIPKETYEFALLYGIRRDEQLRLARAGHGVRVLISYGSYWFPWYMRRLAERPANVLFMARSVLGG